MVKCNWILIICFSSLWTTHCNEVSCILALSSLIVVGAALFLGWWRPVWRLLWNGIYTIRWQLNRWWNWGLAWLLIGPEKVSQWTLPTAIATSPTHSCLEHVLGIGQKGWDLKYIAVEEMYVRIRSWRYSMPNWHPHPHPH